LGDGVAEEFVTLLRTVSAKSFAVAQILDRFVHGGDNRRGQRFSDIANAAADQTLGRLHVLFAKLTDTPRDLREKIARLQFQIIAVQVSHRESFCIGMVMEKFPNYFGRKPGGRLDGCDFASSVDAAGWAAASATGSCSPRRSRAFLAAAMPGCSTTIRR